MTDRPSFADKVEAYKADAPARTQKRAARSATKKATDVVINGVILALLLVLVIAVLVVIGFVVAGAWLYILSVMLGVFVLAAVYRARR